MPIHPLRFFRAPAAVATAAAVSLILLPTAHAGDLAAFLERAERMSAPNEKVEADVTIKDAGGTTSKAHLVIDPADGGTVVFEQPATGWKSETPLSWKEGKAVTKTGASSSKLGVDDPLAGTDLRGMD